jgi:hypothetical protein
MSTSTHCTSCDAPLPDDGKKRTRNRDRHCAPCLAKKRKSRRQADPVALLTSRWTTNAKKHWGKKVLCSLYSRQTVQKVYERWDKRCVITGASDVLHLCIAPAVRSKDEAPDVSQLVILTTNEAQSLARVKGLAERMARFPKDVQDALLRGQL